MEYLFEENRLFYKHEITERPTKEYYFAHTHGEYELLYFVSGDASHIIEDRRYKLSPGDLMLIRPLRYHYINIDTPRRYERYDLLFDPVKLGITSIDLFPADADIIHLGEGTVADGIIRRIDGYIERLPRERIPDMLTVMLKELFYALSTVDAETGEYSMLSPLLTRALGYINDNLYTLGDISEVANSLFVSKSYLYRLFAKELKKTPKDYVMEKRLLTAREMIRGGKRPTEIYSKCGFTDYTVFYRNYKSYFGKAPSKESGAGEDCETVQP